MNPYQHRRQTVPRTTGLLFVDNVWINAHSPDAPASVHDCEGTSAFCIGEGVTILGSDGSPVDLTPFTKVKVEEMDINSVGEKN